MFFGPYRIATRIATGGMAEVFAARRVSGDGSAGAIVAVKRLLPHLQRDSNVVRMFLNEARITAQIHHPNVVRVLDLGQHDGAPYIAMELLEGHSFAELREAAALRGERVPLGVTLKVLTDACRGLDAAHRAVDEAGRALCIVHRDFTPDNLHVGADGLTKVIDFGIAKAANLGVGTEPGTLKGKFFYMSPEMIAGRQVDHRADLYAAGVMLYEQLCGRRPFSGTSPDEVIRKIALAQLRRPTEFDPSLPVALETICLLALEREPSRRFGSLQDFIDAIEALGGTAEVASAAQVAAYVDRIFPGEEDERRARVREARRVDPSGARPVPLTPEVREEPRAPKRRKVRAPVWIAALLAVAAMGGAGAYLLHPGPTADELLRAAAAAADGAERVSLLGRVHHAREVTAAQLERAASALLEANAPNEALPLIEARLAQFPSTESSHLLEARAAIALHRGKRAEAAIAAARTLAPQSSGPDVVLADLRELQGDLGGAAQALEEAIARAPQPDDTLVLRRALLLSRAGRLDDADGALRAVLSRHFDPTAAAELAFVRFRQDRANEALPLLRRAIAKDPASFRAHYYLGAVLFRQGDTDGALRAYAEAERLAPEDPRPLVALCELAGRSGRKADLAAAHRRIDGRFAGEAAELKRQCGFAP